ncbi:MAG: hypothetical protein OJF51_003654 [Nitrospira sp.]|nr:MAG: hypothetical protein OJF51_003654 [Nitrospira sp.]
MVAIIASPLSHTIGNDSRGCAGRQIALRNRLAKRERFLYRQWDVEGIDECRDVQMRPAPVRRVGHQLRAHGIEQDVARYGRRWSSC